MKCNIIAQRISLQEYMRGQKADEVQADVDEWTQEEDKLSMEEKLKILTRQHFEEMLDKWCEEFEIEQPSEFFKKNPTNDAELVCSI